MVSALGRKRTVGERPIRAASSLVLSMRPTSMFGAGCSVVALIEGKQGF